MRAEMRSHVEYKRSFQLIARELIMSDGQHVKAETCFINGVTLSHDGGSDLHIHVSGAKMSIK